MSEPTCRVAVIGAGLVGERHARLVAEHRNCSLAALIDPRQEIDELAKELSTIRLDHVSLLPEDACDAVIIATPNHNHFPTAMACLKRTLPCLVEKPITDSLEKGEELVSAFEEANIPMLVGHHRRYHPVVTQTKELLASDEIGTPICASTIWAVKKPESYFREGAWRLGEDGGPIMINFIHEVDLMRCIFGEITEVSAMSSKRQRATDVEDTAAIIMRFESGLIATATLTDSALTPWSFEGAIDENPNIASTGVSSWRIGCAEGAFEFPLLRIWKNAGSGRGDWSKPLTSSSIVSEKVVPLKLQLDHFISLARGKTDRAMVSGREGLNSLRAVRAILRSTSIGQPVSVADINDNSQRRETV